MIDCEQSLFFFRFSESSARAREPIRVGGGLKKIFRPFGPQFGLKIRKNKGGGPPGSRPSPGSFTVDTGELVFSTITDLFGKIHVSLFSVAFY